MALIEIVIPSFVREDARGLFAEVVNGGPWETIITGSMRPGAVLGHHYHKLTDMLLYLSRGSAEVTLVDVRTGERAVGRIEPRQAVRLPPQHAHAVRFLEASDFLLLKSRRFDQDDPDTFPYPLTDVPATM